MTGDSAESFLAQRSLYLCTPDRPDIERFVSDCIEGGVDVVQLRDKVLEAKPLIARAKIVKRVCAAYRVPFILNDRPDLALEVDADGVHVGQDDAPAALARSILGPDRIIGLSTHEPAQLKSARAEPVDYVSAGPVVPTPTKPGRVGTGIDYISEARNITTVWPGRDRPMPFFVTGGVTPESIPELVRMGATRFVVVRYLTNATEPKAAARSLRSAIDISLDQQRSNLR